MITTRSTLLTAAVLAAGLGLAACGNNNNSSNNGSNPQTPNQPSATTSTSNAATNAGNEAVTAGSDASITAAVKAKLLANSSTSGMEIHVTTNHGVVTLSGTVGSDAERQLAERIARDTDGVTDVTNNLKVKGS